MDPAKNTENRESKKIPTKNSDIIFVDINCMIIRAGRASLKGFRVCAHFTNSFASRVFAHFSQRKFRAF